MGFEIEKAFAPSTFSLSPSCSLTFPPSCSPLHSSSLLFFSLHCSALLFSSLLFSSLGHASPIIGYCVIMSPLPSCVIMPPCHSVVCRHCPHRCCRQCHRWSADSVPGRIPVSQQCSLQAPVLLIVPRRRLPRCAEGRARETCVFLGF